MNKKEFEEITERGIPFETIKKMKIKDVKRITEDMRRFVRVK